jgi:hypothetical protein
MERMRSVQAISFNLIVLALFYPISETSSYLSSASGKYNFPDNKSLNPHVITFERKISVQIGDSSAIHQKKIL